MVLLDIKTEQSKSKSLKTTKIQVELAMRADVSHSKELAHVLEAFKAARLAEVILSQRGELICSHLVKP